MLLDGDPQLCQMEEGNLRRGVDADGGHGGPKATPEQLLALGAPPG